MDGTICIEGAQGIIKAFRVLSRRYRAAFGSALYMQAQVIMAQSKRLVPVDTGRLRATGYVGPPESRGLFKMVVQLGYGTEYALPVHENEDARHTPGLTAKFLEKPANDAAPKAARRIAIWTKQFMTTNRGFGAATFPASPQDKGAEWQKQRQTALRKKAARASKRTGSSGRGSGANE